MPMMRIIFIISCFLTSLFSFAEDIIVLKSGDIVRSKVIEVQSDLVKYKKASNLNGPIYSVSTDLILSIEYENGEQDKFTNAAANNSSSGKISDGPKFVERKIDSERNKYLLSQYRLPHDYYGNKKPSDATTDKGTAFFAFTDNSVLSNEDIEISFKEHISNHFYPNGDYLKEAIDKYGCYYEIRIKNKTNRIIYIDCANCYIMDNEGDFSSFYDGKVYSEQHGGSKSAFFNVGGITNALGIGGLIAPLANATTLGSTSMSGVSVSSTGQQIMSIPPNGTIVLPPRKYVGKNSIFERYEYFPRPYYPQVTMKKWQPMYFDEGDLPSYLKFVITYSDSPTFDVYSNIQCELYCYEIMGQLFDYMTNNKLHNFGPYIIFKRMDNKKPLFAPIYNQFNGKPLY